MDDKSRRKWGLGDDVDYFVWKRKQLHFEMASQTFLIFEIQSLHLLTLVEINESNGKLQ
jgi:hypothetical protein